MRVSVTILLRLKLNTIIYFQGLWWFSFAVRVLNVGPPGALTRLRITSVEELTILGPTPLSSCG